MAVGSLTKMTIPLGGIPGSDQSNENQGLLMPKMKYRFRVFFENFGVSKPTTELTKQVMDFTRPSVSFEDVPIEIYNSRLYLAGKYTWEEVTVNLRDDASGQVARLVGEQVQKQFDFFEQASAASGIDYKFVTKFQVLDGARGVATESVLETWELYGCYVRSVNYNDANYGESAPMTIAMNIRFDNALQTPIGDGIGATVARTVNDVITGVPIAR